MSMHVCMSVCEYVCVSMHVCASVCVHAVCMYVHDMYMRMCHTHTCVCTYVCVHAWMSRHMCVCVCAFVVHNCSSVVYFCMYT